jgi:uncharacterized protein
MSDTRNLETVQAIYAAFGAGDIPTILGHLAQDVAWESWDVDRTEATRVPWLVERKGRDDVVGFFEVVGSLGIEDFQVLGLMAGGDQVTAEITLRAGELADEELHLWTFGADGEVTRFRHYVDTAKHVAEARRRGMLTD